MLVDRHRLVALDFLLADFLQALVDAVGHLVGLVSFLVCRVVCRSNLRL